MDTSGCGAVRLAHLLWEQGVGGSNPLTPTDDRLCSVDIKPFFIEGLLFYQKLSDIYHNYTNNGHRKIISSSSSAALFLESFIFLSLSSSTFLIISISTFTTFFIFFNFKRNTRESLAFKTLN